MNSKTSIVKILVVSLILVMPTALAALDLEPAAQTQLTSPCGDLVKECFVGSPFDRSSCFYSAAKHPFCNGSELSELLELRWQSGANRPNDYELQNSRIPDQQLVNGRCLDAVDNKLSASLFAGTLNHRVISKLIDELVSCNEKFMIDLVRP